MGLVALGTLMCLEGAQKPSFPLMPSFRFTSPLTYKAFVILAWLTVPGKFTLSQFTIFLFYDIVCYVN